MAKKERGAGQRMTSPSLLKQRDHWKAQLNIHRLPPITKMGDILPQKCGIDFFGVTHAASVTIVQPEPKPSKPVQKQNFSN